MSEPPIWTAAELADDGERAKAAFRARRLREPLELYSRFFQSFAPVVAGMIDRLPGLTTDAHIETDAVADIIADEDLRTAFRYLAAPPISEDDLKTLAETKLSATALRSDVEQARRVRETVLQVIDPHRFPWIADGRSPTEAERLQAIVSSAALIATRKVETARRSAAKDEQEAAVKAMLLQAGFVEVRVREIPMLDAAPQTAEFCGECSFGGTRADLVVRLPDGRVAPIECKASNSAVNSYKRINHEALSKAHTWLEAFGTTGGTHRRDRWRVQPRQFGDSTRRRADDHLAPSACRPSPAGGGGRIELRRRPRLAPVLRSVRFRGPHGHRDPGGCADDAASH